MPCVVGGCGECHVLLVGVASTMCCWWVWQVPCVVGGCGKCHVLLVGVASAMCCCNRGELYIHVSFTLRLVYTP